MQDIFDFGYMLYTVEVSATQSQKLKSILHLQKPPIQAACPSPLPSRLSSRAGNKPYSSPDSRLRQAATQTGRVYEATEGQLPAAPPEVLPASSAPHCEQSSPVPLQLQGRLSDLEGFKVA